MLFLALVFTGMLTILSSAHADALTDIMHRGVLRVAVPQDFPPFGSIGPDLKPHGMDISVAELIAKQMHVKVDLVPVSSVNRIPYLTTHKVDLVISSLGKNAAREKVIDFSDAYAPFYLGVFGPADMKLDGPAGLAGKTIAVTRGAIEDLKLTAIAPKSAVIKRFENNDATISAYLSGQTELIASGNLVMTTIAKRNPQRMPVMKIQLKNSPCYVGLNKGEPALMAKVNAIIAGAKKDGALNALSEKWLKQPLPANL
jgi:polar amino acid transport system substrate-binding protein